MEAADFLAREEAGELRAGVALDAARRVGLEMGAGERVVQDAAEQVERAVGPAGRGQTVVVEPADHAGARVEIEKPVFDIGTPEGRCLPDFLVTVRRDADEVRFVIEVMGFTRASYLEGKQETHPRMETLGTLCKMQATEFGEGKDGANAEGRKVTQRIRGILAQRWAQ